MGEVDQRADEFVAWGRSCAAEGDFDRALEYFSRALSFDPSRLEVHVDLAKLDLARGNHSAALRRLRAVAAAYDRAGDPSAAGDVREFAAALSTPDASQVIEAPPGTVLRPQTGSTEPMGLLLPTPRKRPREETVLAKTILLFPDGSPMPTGPQPVAAAEPRKPTKSRPMRTRFRVAAPPMIRRPR
jgi:tetratricopeptide (TPR) repeat protein